MVDSAGGVTAIDLPAAFDGKCRASEVIRDELDREWIHRYAILD